MIGVSKRGLQRLGVPDESLETFPVAFKQGMWTEPRARELGDTGDSAPAKWKWGVPSKDADVFVLVYGLTQVTLDDMLSKLSAETAALGHRLQFVQQLTMLQYKHDEKSCGISSREPF